MFTSAFAHAQDPQIVGTSTLVPSFVQPIGALRTRDFDSDDSLQKYLSEKTPFHTLNYEPSDLASINSNFTANDARHFKLRQEAGDMFADLAWHFWDHFKGDRLAIVSAYRSKTYQDTLVKR
ncbi:MAG: hypothetical protein WCJ39_06695 [bacterium]